MDLKFSIVLLKVALRVIVKEFGSYLLFSDLLIIYQSHFEYSNKLKRFLFRSPKT